jgi:hypothetical protein
MKITIEATAQLMSIDGVPVRLWRGVTDGNVPCLVFVHRLAVSRAEDASQFDKELLSMPAPAAPIDMRNIL